MVGIWMGIATIVAVILGPILAVCVTRYIDESRLKQTRRMDVFRTLMRTRRIETQSRSRRRLEPCGNRILRRECSHRKLESVLDSPSPSATS